MEKNTLASRNSAGMGMYEFFYEQFKTLRARTGIRQWETLNELPKEQAAKEIHSVIDFMCQECQKPPFDKVEDIVKQCVIDRAVVEDNEFIGMNAKFVKRALNAWWLSNGDRVLEKLNAKEAQVYERIERTPEQRAEIDRMLNEFKARILQGDGPKPVPKMEAEEVAVVGREWKSELERKGINYPPDTAEKVLQNELHREWIRQNFDIRTGDKLPTWKPEQQWVESLSEEQKVMIFKKAGIV